MHFLVASATMSQSPIYKAKRAFKAKAAPFVARCEDKPEYFSGKFSIALS